MKKRILSILLTVCMALSLLPMSAFATEGNAPIGTSGIEDPALCEHHAAHNEDCGYSPATEEVPCRHEHDLDCGFMATFEAIPATDEISCDKNCTDTDDEGVIKHIEGCAYTPAVAVAPSVDGTPCEHQHNEACGYTPASEGKACGYACAEYGTDLLQQQSIMPFVTEPITDEDVANGQYHLSYVSSRTGGGMTKPVVGGTDDNAPVFTFTRPSGTESGGVFTSNYTMDFTRSFHIEGSVSAAERDGVSFALHTTNGKKAFSPSFNTLMMGKDLLNEWKQSETSWTVDAAQNNITNGLLWDFMTCDDSRYQDTRFYKGAYSYQIESPTFVKALPADSNGTGIIDFSASTVDGDFKLSWKCTDATNATGDLTIQMGEGITFTYTGLIASNVFGDLSKAKAVYFSFSTYLPKFNPGEKINETTISIAKAYYTDTIGEDGNSTLNLETSYYIDKDGDSTTYETKLDGKTPLVAGQKVLCRNEISNPNQNATTALGMTLLINNLSQTVNGEETQIASIEDEKYYLHEHDATEETEASGKISSEGNGPLNSTAPLTDYAKVTLPAGGSGTAAYDDAYAVYEYTCTPGAGVTALKQTIQLGVAPFSPKVSESTVSFPLPTAKEYAEAEPAATAGTDYVLDTEQKTLIIKTDKGAAHFSANGSTYLNYKVTLNDDIDVSAFRWTPVGTNVNHFTGTFDGGNHELHNLTVTTLNTEGTSGGVAGVFGATKGTSTVKNLTVSGSVNVSGTNLNSVGGIVGSSGGTIDNCTNKAAITLNTSGGSIQESHTGGIAGTNFTGGTIRNCNNTGSITAKNPNKTFAGGIIGTSRGGNVQNCFNTGAVTASGGSSMNYSGGIAGQGDDAKATITNCYSTGTLPASDTNAKKGGICGKSISNRVEITNCYYLSTETVSNILGDTQTTSITGCGTFADSIGTLTAGTSTNCGAGQTLESYATTLLGALNGWVTAAASTDNYTWVADSTQSPANSGYPVFDKAWVAVLPTAAEYATALPAAAAGTDYVVDTTAKTLIIKTTKGAAHFSASGTDYLDYKVSLANTIDVSAFSWKPVGNNDNHFTGTFDGGNHELQNLNVTTLNTEGSYGSVAGMFGSINDTGTVKNLTVTGSVNVSGTDACSVGGIVGSSGGTIDNCTNNATITLNTSGKREQSYTGGIAGTNRNSGKIRNCNNTGAITAKSPTETFAGGIVGTSRGGSVQNCFNTGAVTASGGSSMNYSGGIVGLGCEAKATIANCYSTGAVTASGSTDTKTGGICGSNSSDVVITNCYYLSSVATKIIDSTQNINITGCGTFEDSTGTLTAGTAENCGNKQDLANYATNLLGALNGWVNTAANTDYYTWKADSATPANGGYPVFSAAWAAGTVSVTGVTLNKTTLSLYSNSTPSNGILTETVAPATASNKAVTWKSSNTAVATVSGGVVTAVGNGTATITVTTTDGDKTATCTVTVSTYTSITPPPVTKPTEPVTGSTESRAIVDVQGNAIISLTDKNITDAIANAKAEAAKKGVNAGDTTAVILVTTDGKDASTLTVNLPKTTQELVIGNKIAKVELVIDRPDLTISIDLKALIEINRQAKANVQLSATKTDAAKLSTDAKNVIGSRPVYDLKVTYQSGGKSVSDFGTGTVSVEIPYKLQNGEKAGNIYVVYVDANGKVAYLQNSSYDAKRKSVIFATNHFSVYGVGYKANTEKFSDITNHWAKDSIEFVAARGLMNDIGNGAFSPDAPMTRGMFVTALGRLANADVSGYKKSTFSDVKADAYYMSYIEWAAKSKIVEGIGEGKFAPDGLVTREQMAAIMDRCANAIGFKLPEVHAAKTFADSRKIGGWSASSVKRIQMAGILQGKTGNFFDPQGTVTRAEVAAMLQRFVELEIFSDTAQGWMMNDSGKWMYYENGKAVTGKKAIGGTTYKFNQYGEIVDVPKNLNNTTYTVQKGDSFRSIAWKYKCSMLELARVNSKSIFNIIYPGEVLKVPEN